MRFANLLPLALSANAFLVPTEVKEDVEITKKIPSSAKAELIQLECDGGCPVYLNLKVENGVPRVHTQDYSSKLVADVTVNDNKVLFNGQQIWPRTLAQPLSMKQAIKGDIDEAFEGLLPVSTSVNYKDPVILVDSTTSMTIHPISIEILSLLDVVVHAQSMEVRVAETENGIGLLPSKISAYEPSPYTDNCTTVWCRVKGTVAKKFDEWRKVASKKIGSFRGCGRKPVHTINGLPVKGGPAKFAPGSTLDPNRHRGKEGHHEHHHGPVRGFFISLFETVIFPTIFGLSVGLIVGSFFWLIINTLRRFRNTSQVDYIVVEQVEVEEGRIEPPKYEEVYREPQIESEDEKKELLL